MANDPMTIRPSAEVRGAIEAAALAQGRPLSQMACKILRDWMEGLEAAAQAQAEAEQRRADEQSRYAALCAAHGLPANTPPVALNEAMRRHSAEEFKRDCAERGHHAALADYQPEVRGARGPGEP
jgi:hypothetical protein